MAIVALYLVGLCGSGKSTVRDIAAELGASPGYTGEKVSVLSPLARLNSQRKETSTDVLGAAISRARIHPNMSPILVVEAMRSLSELQYVRTLPEKAYLIAVNCGKIERYRRLNVRNGADAEEVVHRDEIELGADGRFAVARLMGVSDFCLDTDSHPDRGIVRDYLRFKLRRIFQEVLDGN